MSNPAVPGRVSFEENLNTLLEELSLAFKYDRPSILLVVHKSKFGQDKAVKALEERLAKLGRTVTHMTVDQEHSDIPHLMLASPAASATVFFVSNLDWGAGPDRRDAYRALNIYRELFVDHHLHMVLWLTAGEAATLARFAPDFWSFRHRVIEFTGQRIPRQVKLPAGVLLWDIQNSVDPFDTLPARIAVREELLAKLPHNAEARSSRIDLLYNLGYLHWAAGEADQADQKLKAGLDLASGGDARDMRSALLNGLAVLSYDAQDYAAASDLLHQALQERPEDVTLLINLSAASNALGRNQEAIRLAKQATRLKPRDARIWNAKGYIHAATGHFDEAIAAFDKAIELAPRAAPYHAALAICYDLVERTDDTARELAFARKLASGELVPYLEIYGAALHGRTAASLDLARAAIHAGQLSPVDLRRDPNLSLLMDPAQLGDISA
jgi:tetratricopeptide repeat protein